MVTNWARRLMDARQSLINAAATYFDPDLFRQNINNAILASRTVTFLMQKEKKSKEGFEEYYLDNVRAPLEDDRIMNWLVDARNTIEKKCDLEVNSYWRAYHIHSYFEVGPEIRAQSRGDLFLKLPALKKVVVNNFPRGVAIDSIVAVDRKWVANSLPEFELIDAVSYGYETLRGMVLAMDAYVQVESPHELLEAEPLVSTAQLRKTFIKVSNNATIRLGLEFFKERPSEDLRKSVKSMLGEAGCAVFEENVSTRTVEENVNRLADVASRVFLRDGFHIHLCVLFSGDRLSGMISFQPNDQAEKYVFWHELAYCIALWGVTEMYLVSEAWLRRHQGFEKSISEMPIIGERLHVRGIRNTGEYSDVLYGIDRSNGKVLFDISEGSSQIPNVLVPALRAWGYDWEWIGSRLCVSKN